MVTTYPCLVYDSLVPWLLIHISAWTTGKIICKIHHGSCLICMFTQYERLTDDSKHNMGVRKWTRLGLIDSSINSCNPRPHLLMSEGAL